VILRTLLLSLGAVVNGIENGNENRENVENGGCVRAKQGLGERKHNFLRA
jgi:hypothetical protein